MTSRPSNLRAAATDIAAFLRPDPAPKRVALLEGKGEAGSILAVSSRTLYVFSQASLRQDILGGFCE